MIMRGTTVGPALGWASFLVVLGLGALLLPLWPSWAQDAPSPANADEPAQAGAVADGSVIAQVADKPAQAGTVAGRLVIAQVAGAADQPTATTSPAADKPKHSEDLQAARDEVGILEAQLEVKRAEAAEVQTRIGIAKRRLERIRTLFGRGAVSSEELENAKDEVELLEAQLAPKRAYIAEAELRLKQAHRRLEGASRAGEQPSTRASVTTNPYTGSVIRGAVNSTTVRPDAVGTSPAASSAVRGADSAGWATPPAPSNQTAPATSYRTAAGVTLVGDHEQRLRELEKKMDDLLKEVKALRRDMRPRRVPEPAK